MASKTKIALTISDQYGVDCECIKNKWTVDGNKVIGSIGAKQKAKEIHKGKK